VDSLEAVALDTHELGDDALTELRTVGDSLPLKIGLSSAARSGSPLSAAMSVSALRWQPSAYNRGSPRT
jgi:hypothetical protein